MILDKMLNIKGIPMVVSLYGVEPPIEEKSINNGVIAIIAVSIFALVGLGVLVGRKMFRKFSKKKDNNVNNESETKE